MSSDIEVPGHLIELKKEFIALEQAGAAHGTPEWTRLQEITLQIHRDPWWLEVTNRYEAHAAMTKAARDALEGS